MLRDGVSKDFFFKKNSKKLWDHVAGRSGIPALLAEAGAPYDMIFQLEDINDQFATTDVSLVIGANDLRCQGKAYAGIMNELFFEENTNMVYGDAGAVLGQMIEAVKGLGNAAAA